MGRRWILFMNGAATLLITCTGMAALDDIFILLLAASMRRAPRVDLDGGKPYEERSLIREDHAATVA